MVRILVFLAVLLLPAEAWATKSISFTFDSSTPSTETTSVSVSVTVTNTGNEPFPIADLGNASFTGYMNGGWKFVPARTTLWASTDCLVHSGDKVPPSDLCSGLGLTPLTSATSVTIGSFVNTDPTESTFSGSLLIGGADYSVALPSSRLLRLTYTVPSQATSLALLAAELPSPVDGVNGSWREIPNSTITSWSDGCNGSAGDQTDTPCQGTGSLIRVSTTEANAIGNNLGGTEGSNSVWHVWNGAAYCKQRQKIYFFGGGHNAYFGNEIYEFDLNTTALTRLIEPSARNSSTPGGDSFPDSGPQTSHTYGGIVCVEDTDEIWITSVGVDNQGAANERDDENKAGVFDLNTNTWSLAGDWGEFVLPYAQTFYDPNTGDVCFAGGLQLSGYTCVDVATQTRSVAETSTLFDWGPGMSLPWNGGSLAFTDNALGNGTLKAVNITATTISDLAVIPINVQGSMAHRGNELIFTDGSGTIYRYNIFTGAAQSLSPSSPLPTGALPEGGGNSTRVYNKFIYIAELDAFLMVHSVLEGIWLYCLPEGCQTPKVPIVTKSFEDRCAHTPNILYCSDFNDSQDLGTQDFNDNVFRFHSLIGDCGTTVCPQINGGSLRMPVPSNSGQNTSGQWAVRFGNISGETVGDGETLSVEWDQYIDAGMLNNFDILSGNGGWKQIIIGEGQNSCSDGEIVFNQYNQSGMLKIYNGCPSGAFGTTNLFTSEPGNDFDLQPGGDQAGICSWLAVGANGGEAAGVPNCVIYEADKWHNFKIQIDFSAVYADDDRVRVWQTVEGGSEQLIIDVQWQLNYSAPYDVVWMTNFHTEKDPAETHAATYVEYDNLIIAAGAIN